MRENGRSANGNAVPRDDMPGRPPEDSGLILDEELNSAAKPFLYLLASVLAAAGAYLLYVFLHG